MYRTLTAVRRRGTRTASFALGVVASLGAQANPQGPDVASGMARFVNPNATTLEVTNSPAAIINWQSFDIGAGETTRFIQQDAASAVLNRVTTQNSSEILGNLVSNGRVFLINPSGIVIGRDGTVDTAGLVLSTLDISDEDFRTGRWYFEGGPDSGGITNHGYIKTAPGGEIVLLAPRILNAPEGGNDKSGIIESENGELVLAAGYAITVTSLDDPDITFEVQAPANEVVNLGQLLAKGGTASVLAGTIRHSGEINADSLSVDETGRVVLTASQTIETTAESRISVRGGEAAPGGTVEIRGVTMADTGATAEPAATRVAQAGTIDATGVTGGSVKIEADAASVAGTVDASGAAAGGRIEVLGNEVAVAGGTVLANATAGSGGAIRIGGDLQGGDALRAASTTTVAAGSLLAADAKDAGNAGSVIVWSNEQTDFRGAASARGGAAGGDGGLIEVSGKETLGFAGSIDVGSPFGKAGTLLLDPRTIVIIPGAATASIADGTPFAGDHFGSSFAVLTDRIVITNQDADVAGFTDAGEITVLDHFGNTIGSFAGNATNERLGSFGFFSPSVDTRLYLSPNATHGGLANAGAVILFSLVTGTEVGRSGGLSANEQFGLTVNQLGANFVVRSAFADIGGNADAGQVVTVSGSTGLALGSVAGGSAGELFGQTVNFFSSAPDTFVVRASGADVGGNADVGRVVLVSSLTGAKLGEVAGVAAGDAFGGVVDLFGVPAGRYLIRASGADVGGLTNNGIAVLVDNATGVEVGRASGLANNDALGTFAPLLRGSGNYFLQVPNATIGGSANAGSLVLVNGASGTRIGSVDGNGASEFLGNVVDTFFLGGNDVLLRSSAHDNGGLVDAGGVFVVADVLLPGPTIVRGQTLGVSAGEFFGANSPTFISSTRFAMISENADRGGFSDNGSVVLIDSLTGLEVGRVDGQSDSEFLGSEGILARFTGHYFIFSSGADTLGGSAVDAGAVILADGTTGNELGRFEGDTSGEFFGSNRDAFSLFNGDLLVYAPDHNGTRGLVAQLAAAPISPGVIARAGGAAGTEAGDRVGGEFAIFLPGGNYIVPVPTLANTPTVPNVGGLFVVDDATGAVIPGLSPAAGLIGSIAGERFGDPSEIDTGILGFSDRFVIRSPEHGANQNGAIFFVNGADGGGVLATLNGGLDDNLGSADLLFAPSGNLIVPVPGAEVGGLFVDGGSVLLLDPTTFALLGQTDGISPNENFGDPGFIDTFSLCCGGDFLVHSPLRDVSGNADAGAVVIVSGTAGTVLGAINGQEAGDNLGEERFATQLSSGNFVLFNPSADTAGGAIADAGAVILVDATLFQEMGGDGAGRFYGQSVSEGLGSDGFVVERGNGNYFVTSRFADPGGVVNAGTLYLASGATGQRIGQADGDTAGEQFSSTVDFFSLFNGDVLVRSSSAHSGGGTVVQIAESDLGAGTVIRGRLDGTAGTGALEGLGGFGFQLSPNGTHYFVPSPNADAGAVTDAGSIYFVDIATGSQSGRIDGTSANEFLGSASPLFRPNGNLVIRSLSADVGAATDAGRMIVADGTGAILGQFTGNHTGEQFGNIIDFFTLPNDLLVRAPLHDNGGLTAAGGFFALADVNLGGGSILRWQLLGSSANEQLGNVAQTSLSATAMLIRSPDADIGGLADAGEALLFNPGTGTVLGRTQGISAGERFGLLFPGFTAETNFLFRSPTASPGGLTDAGRVVLMSGATGTLIGATNGTSANEQFGAFGSVSLVNGALAFLSPDADVGGLVDAGAIVQVDPTTGLEVTRIVGISANERLGAFFSQQLPNGTRVFSSPDADVGGVVDAGRLVFFNPVGGDSTAAKNLVFSDSPGGDFVLTTGSIQNALASGATLVLQSNSDIIFAPGTRIFAPTGNLVLQAGRSVIFEAGSPGSTFVLRDLKIVANESAVSGVDLVFRGPGDGDVLIDTSQLAGIGRVTVSGQHVDIVAGDDPLAVFAPISSADFFAEFLADPAGFALPASFVLGGAKLEVFADDLFLGGGDTAGAFAALVSFGEFTIDATSIELAPGLGENADAVVLGLGGLLDIEFDTCIGCGDELLLTDPFLDSASQSGIFISGVFQNPSIDAILAMLGRDNDEDEDEEEEDEEEVQECN